MQTRGIMPWMDRAFFCWFHNSSDTKLTGSIGATNSIFDSLLIAPFENTTVRTTSMVIPINNRIRYDSLIPQIVLSCIKLLSFWRGFRKKYMVNRKIISTTLFSDFSRVKMSLYQLSVITIYKFMLNYCLFKLDSLTVLQQAMSSNRRSWPKRQTYPLQVGQTSIKWKCYSRYSERAPSWRNKIFRAPEISRTNCFWHELHSNTLFPPMVLFSFPQFVHVLVV